MQLMTFARAGLEHASGRLISDSYIQSLFLHSKQFLLMLAGLDLDWQTTERRVLTLMSVLSNLLTALSSASTRTLASLVCPIHVHVTWASHSTLKTDTNV